MRTTQALKGIPWYNYSQQHMNEHMAEHETHSKKVAFTGFDLELCYLSGYEVKDFQTICQNRIIKTLSQQNGTTIEKKLGKVKSFHNTHDVKIVHPYNICYQAQNLVYMYALGLVDILDRSLVQATKDYNVSNGERKSKEPGDIECIIPIFDSIIGMQDEIRLEDIEDVRLEYIKKRPLAEEIKYQSKYHRLRLHDTILLTDEQKAMVA